MSLFKKRRYKPFYKQFLKLKQNVQNRPKIFKFNKQKWKRFKLQYERQLKFYKRFKLKDSFKLTVTKFASKGNSFQKNYRNFLHKKKIFNLSYGGLKQKYFKKHFNVINRAKKQKISNFNTLKHNLLKFFESRLDIILYRAKFSLNVKSARQLIKHGHILVNNRTIKSYSYTLKTNDLIKINYNIKSRNLIKKNIDKSNFWPIPPKYLIINYNSLQIIFVYDKNSNFLSKSSNPVHLSTIFLQ